MAETALKGNPVLTSGELPELGSPAPEFDLVAPDLSPLRSSDLGGQNIVLNIFPSLDTGTCAASVREFNKRAVDLENTTVVNVSADLPFAQRRFCGNEGIDKALAGSTFRNPEFGDAYGTRLVDGPMSGLHARSVVVIGADGNVRYTQLVDDIGTEPDYDSAIAAI